MLTPKENILLAELLFPEVKDTVLDLEKKYPPRGTIATRIAPSPTGFFHIGNMYPALIDDRVAHAQGGIFYLRIEDTDQERLVVG